MAAGHVGNSGDCTKITNGLYIVTKNGLTLKQTFMGTITQQVT